jgi:hypothetical protein
MPTKTELAPTSTASQTKHGSEARRTRMQERCERAGRVARCSGGRTQCGTGLPEQRRHPRSRMTQERCRCVGHLLFGECRNGRSRQLRDREEWRESRRGETTRQIPGLLLACSLFRFALSLVSQTALRHSQVRQGVKRILNSYSSFATCFSYLRPRRTAPTGVDLRPWDCGHQNFEDCVGVWMHQRMPLQDSIMLCAHASTNTKLPNISTYSRKVCGLGFEGRCSILLIVSLTDTLSAPPYTNQREATSVRILLLSQIFKNHGPVRRPLNESLRKCRTPPSNLQICCTLAGRGPVLSDVINTCWHHFAPCDDGPRLSVCF